MNFLCGDPEWSCQVWQSLANGNAIVRLSLVKSAIEGHGWRGTDLQEVIERALQVSITIALHFYYCTASLYAQLILL